MKFEIASRQRSQTFNLYTVSRYTGNGNDGKWKILLPELLANVT